MTYSVTTTLCRALLFCFALLSLSSCRKGKEDVVFLHSYVNEYVDGEFILSFHENSLYLSMWTDGPRYHSPETRPKDKTNAEFLRIADRNGDRSYDRRGSFSEYTSRTCFVDNFKAVRIVCLDKAWDDRHPSGALLNDLVQIKYTSYAPYVHSGYDKALQYIEHIRKPLSELVDTDLIMINPNIDFYVQNPAVSGTYQVQVTMVTTEGKERVATCTVDIE